MGRKERIGRRRERENGRAEGMKEEGNRGRDGEGKGKLEGYEKGIRIDKKNRRK